MNQNNRFCKMKGHEEFYASHICSLLECNQPTRRCCYECIQQGIHNHNKPNNLHVMEARNLCIKLQSESENPDIQKLILFYIIKVCQRLENSLMDYRKSILSQIQNITQQQIKFKSYLKNQLVKNKFDQLDDITITELFKINLLQNQKQQLLPLDDIKQQLYSIESIIKDYQENKNDNSNSNSKLDLKNSKYIKEEIDMPHLFDVNNGSQISKNERYLSYADAYQVLNIYDIKLKKIIKEIQLDNYMSVCQFTHDSSQLYVGIWGGYVYGYDVQDDFKEIYKQQIHKGDVYHIYHIITIQNKYLITCSGTQIIKTDVKRKKKIFKLNGSTQEISAIDYNYKDDIIICGSIYESIKLWNCRNLSIIIDKEYTPNHGIQQIQLINNNLNILSLDMAGNLYKWKIDFINKDLIKLQKFSDQHGIFNFYSVNSDENLILMCNYYVKILNQEGETINTIEHGFISNPGFICRQLDDLKCIQIRLPDRIILAVAQE